MYGRQLDLVGVMVLYILSASRVSRTGIRIQLMYCRITYPILQQPIFDSYNCESTVSLFSCFICCQMRFDLLGKFCVSNFNFIVIGATNLEGFLPSLSNTLLLPVCYNLLLFPYSLSMLCLLGTRVNLAHSFVL